MKATFILLIVFTRVHFLFSQPCAQLHLTIQNQEDLEAFIQSSGGCTELTGDLFITGAIQHVDGLDKIEIIKGNLLINNTTQLENINGLVGLKEVGGYVRIQNNSMLKNLSGLDNLQKIKGDFFYVSNNPHFKNLLPLSNLDSINGIFQVYNMDSLTTLQGLEQVKYIGGDFSVFKNKSLNLFSGLSSLHIISQSMRIYENPELTSLFDLSDSLQIGNQVAIYDNTTLNICNATSICRIVQSRPENCFVTNNVEGCNNITQIFEKCATNTDDSGQFSVSIFPNPTMDILWIEGLTEEVEVIIVNFQGVPVFKQNTTGKINILSLPQGMYLLKIKNQIFRFIKL